MSLNNPDVTYDHNRSVKVESVLLFNFKRDKQLDITNVVSNFVIRESIFENTITGQIVIKDKIDIHSTFPLVGEEFISLSWQIPGSNKTKKYVFMVNTVTSPTINPDGKIKTYKLELSQIEDFKNSFTRLDRATGFKPPGKTVETIMKDDLGTIKEVNITTKGMPLKTVIPGWHPFETIGFLKRKCTVDDDASPLLFFETNEHGFNFITIKKLIEDGIANYDEDKHYLKLFRVASDNEKEINPLLSIIQFDVDTKINTVGQLLQGELKSSTSQINLLDKKIEDIDYDHDFPLVDKKISKHKEHSDDFYKMLKDGTCGKWLTIGDFNYNEASSKNNDVGHHFGNRRDVLNSLETNTVNVLVAGNDVINAGDVVRLRIPESTTVEKNILKEDDDRYSGYYVVDTILHTINLPNEMVSLYKLFSIGSKLNVEKRSKEKI